jgi:hypothetical protein
VWQDGWLECRIVDIIQGFFLQVTDLKKGGNTAAIGSRECAPWNIAGPRFTSKQITVIA